MYKLFLHSHMFIDRKVTSLAIFCFFNFFGLTQNFIINGKVISESGKQEIPYVNIGIKKKNVGTVSDEIGKFSLIIDKKFFDDTLTFSCVGYYELNIPVRKIISENIKEFVLTKKVFTIKEVEISAKKTKIKKIGLTKQFSGASWCPKDSVFDDIVELGQLIKIGKKNSEILSAHIFMKQTNFDSATFRLNFYKYENGEPTERIIEKEIIKKVPAHNGWVSINLEEYNINFKENFVLSIEFLPDRARKSYFCYGGKIGGTTNIFIREKSLGVWEKVPPVVQLSMYVKVRQ